MNLKIKYFLTVDNAYIDKGTGKLTAQGIFDTLYITMFPTKAPKFFVVIGIINIEGSAEILLEINTPDGEKLAEVSENVTAHFINQTEHIIIEMNEFPLLQEGTYNVHVYDKNNMEPLGSYFINANYPPQRYFQAEEIEKILNNPNLVQTVLIKINCDYCGKEHNFSLNLDKNKSIPEDYNPFPKNDLLNCCGKKTINLTGIRRELEWTYGNPISEKKNSSK